jgi:glycogen phosphorylase
VENNIKLNRLFVKSKLPEKLAPLNELSQNLWSTWDMDAYRLFSRIDPNLFRKYQHNPVKLLQVISQNRLEELSQNKGFLFEMKTVCNNFKSYLNYSGHFEDKNGTKHDFPEDMKIAYFSMEFGLHESLPIYSGGLGILSGDHLKAASDLGLPLIGFGLLYKYGYFSQKINLKGIQEEVYKENEWHSMPITRLVDADGSDLEISFKLRNDTITMKAWQINVGKIPLYLLDTNLAVNKPHYRKISDYLYDADKDTRILQEITLAFGSLELIKKLNIDPKVYHLNEGHSAFIILRRLNQLINDGKFNFQEASEIIRQSTVFTTHTPVPAGNEKFESKLVRHYLEPEIKSCGFEFDDFFQEAKIEGDNHFSLPALAIRYSRFINGVSHLHSKVSREMWHSIHKNLYEAEMPIDAITNGVHLQSWLSRRMLRLFDRYIGEDFHHQADDKTLWHNIMTIPESEVWEAHQARKGQMISFIRKRRLASLLHRGSGDSVNKINDILNREKIVIGFARRFATYKRGNLILNDKERVLKMLRNSEKPVQFVFAGKAHPADEKGKAMIKEIIDFASENQVEDRFIFLEDYDINVAIHLVQGVDVWLNNPIKPLEASGTSGMKAGINGVLNLSILDGWWPECARKNNGWSIRSYITVEDQELRDRLEANEIYDILENEIIPTYYNRDKYGLPSQWIEKMKFSIHDVGLGFNMHRMLREYIDKFYIPCQTNVKELAENDYDRLHKILNVKNEIEKFWNNIRILDFQTDISDNAILDHGEVIDFTAKVNIDGAAPELIKAEVFYQLNNGNYELIPLKGSQPSEKGIVIYTGSYLVKGSGEQGFNLRLRPAASYNHEFLDHILWYK